MEETCIYCIKKKDDLDGVTIPTPSKLPLKLQVMAFLASETPTMFLERGAEEEEAELRRGRRSRHT